LVKAQWGADVQPSEIDLDGPIDLGQVGLELATELHGRMSLVREFEQRINKLFLQGRIPGTIHLSLGQEACAVGATAPLRTDDWITITHRGHGQALAKGVPARRLMAELFARETGCCRGRGGSMHIGDVAVGALPAIAIVGAAVPIAAGLAFAARQQGSDRVVVSFFGDGTLNEGDAHEGLNLAALWQLPVVYLCENNLYSISTPLSRQMRNTRILDRAVAYGMAGVVVDGNNVIAVYQAVTEAVERAREGGGPTLVECLTYRQGGHKRDDPATYRPKDEVATWLARDPLHRLRRAFETAGLGSVVEAAQAEAQSLIDDAVEFAEQSPLARPDAT
jgi:acetoin:2,6-dichlorophenolindophenol oxidoreductase subunit alpha